MQGEPVFLRIDGHGAQAELVGGAKDAYSDFAAIGGEQFADRFRFFISEAINASREILHCFMATRRLSCGFFD